MHQNLHRKREKCSTILNINREKLVNQIDDAEQERNHTQLVEHRYVKPKGCFLIVMRKDNKLQILEPF